tara:strand:+ start:346 stop:1986 length:1641 start_codon:yes stop_codon:yes gene_type:complete
MNIVHVAPAPVSEHALTATVRTRDGVELATDVYLPEGALTEPGPTILVRLPYDKAAGSAFPMAEYARYMTERGYRVVLQDVRGKFRSGGASVLFVHEVNDGFDTIDWVINQSWSNGKVGMSGNSYYGYTQWAAVSSRHPALRAIAPRVTGTMLGEPPRELAPGVREVEQSIILRYPLTFFHSADSYFWDMDWSERPWTDQIERFFDEVGGRSVSFDLFYPHPARLQRFPDGSPFEAPAIPVLLTIGWWDNCAPWSWEDRRALQQRSSWSANEYLRIEAIDHYNFVFDHPDRSIEPTPVQMRERLSRALDPTLDFFDVFLRNGAPPTSIPRVTWDLVNGERRTEAQWPPASATTRTLYCTADGVLAEAPNAEESRVTWVHDPLHPVPSAAGDPFRYLLDQPDERELLERDDVVVWRGPAFTDDFVLAGPVSFSAAVQSDGPVMDVIVRLYDLAPGGAATLITRGQVSVETAALRHVEVDMLHAGYLVRPGHRLAVSVCSTDAPDFVPQPGTGEDPWTATTFASNTQTLVLSGDSGILTVTIGESTWK